MKKMIADYMEQGFLENILDMFRHDISLFPLISDLMGDERGRVRIGTVALVEILRQNNYSDILNALQSIAKLLKSTNPTIRGDVAYLLGIIGHADALPYLSEAFHNDEEEIVKKTIREAIEEIEEMNTKN
jgi:hypothetical protein